MKLFIITVLAGFSALNAYGSFELLEAAELGNTAELTSLIDAGADVDFQDYKNNTALMQASRGGHLDIAQTLIDAGADLDIQNYYGDTALKIAFIFRHFDIVQALDDAGADLGNVTIDWEMTPFSNPSKLAKGH